MIKTKRYLTAAAAMLLLLANAGIAQDVDAPTIYVSVDCMKSRSPDYALLESEIWKPMHEELVRRGNRHSWSLYWVMYGDRSRCDYYTVTTFYGEEQLNAGLPVADVFDDVHEGGDLEEAMGRTWASREHVATALWQLVDGTKIGDHRYAVVNMMHAEDPDAYERIERQVFKPGHQALVDGGHRAGWALYELISPLGTSVPYNFSTVDFVSHLSPVPMAEAMIAAHPKRDLDAMQELLNSREQVRSETWVLVSTTAAGQKK